MKPSNIYIAVILIVFAALAVIFLFMPRSTYSELEKRDLAVFPEFSPEKLKGAVYPNEVSHWFSDTEPYRDVFMTFSMGLRDKMRMPFGSDDAVTFRPADNGETPGADVGSDQLAEYENKLTANENAKITTGGIMLIGKAPNVIALNVFGGEATGGIAFANAVSRYARELPGVKVYAMVVPLSSEFYTPDKAKSRTKPQFPFIRNIYSHLTDGAKGVNAYNALASHVSEPIYLRTDHHWAPLGAYYATEAFAKAAGVPFKDLSSYDRRVIKGYVGSMYGYCKDMSLKNSPEDFVFYVPKGASYETTYRDYKLNKSYQVVSESAPAKGEFFYKYNDGNGGAYCTFMGSDHRLTHIHTDARTGRRLVIVKDSYGNPVPSFLFYSFDDIYVVDFRYFSHNMKKFVKDNQVTDLLFAMNVFNAYSSTAPAKIERLLTQGENVFASPAAEPAKTSGTVVPKAPKADQKPKVAESETSVKTGHESVKSEHNPEKKTENRQSSENEGKINSEKEQE